MSKKARIVEHTHPNGSIEYIIQQKHHIFFWRWVDAWYNSSEPFIDRTTFSTLEEAKKSLCFFDGTKHKEVVVD